MTKADTVSDRWATSEAVVSSWDKIIKSTPVFAVYNFAAFRGDFRVMYRRMARIGRLPAGAKVLDLATGGGPLYQWLRPGQHLDYTAVDFSPLMLERARANAAERRLGYIAFEEGNAASLRFDDESFDHVVCYNALHCMPDPGAALKEIARVLRPGGTFWGNWIVRGQDKLADRWIDIGRRRQYFDVCPREDEALEQLESLDFRTIRTSRSGSWLFFDCTKTK
jgi:ubiquinone/menaquinone biosynthesis C-methylase UbiE